MHFCKKIYIYADRWRASIDLIIFLFIKQYCLVIDVIDVFGHENQVETVQKSIISLLCDLKECYVSFTLEQIVLS